MEYMIEGRAAVEFLRVIRQIDRRLKRDGLPAFFPNEPGAKSPRAADPRMPPHN